MALLNKETSEYLVLNLTKSYINVDGMYARVVTYKNEAERHRDKEFLTYFSSFIENYNNLYEKYLREDYDYDNDTLDSLLRKDVIDYLINNFEVVFYTFDEESNNKSILSEEYISEIEKIGIPRKFIDSPIILINEFSILIDDEHLGKFNHTEFYIKLKKTLNNSEVFEYIDC